MMRMDELARRVADWHSPGGSTIHVGRVPDLAGARIPLPPGTRVVGSVVRGPERSPELGRGGDASTAWGRWKLPQDDLETIVVVVAVMPEMRLLEQHTFSPSRQERSRQRSMWSSGTLG